MSGYYSFICRDEHIEVGHNEHAYADCESCPICELLAALREAQGWMRGTGRPDERGVMCETLTEAEEMIRSAIKKAEAR